MAEITMVCSGCSQHFSVPYRSDSERLGKIKFCSLSCFNKTKHKAVECAHCKAAFVIGKSSTKKFCSSSCYQASRNVNPEQRTATCEVCTQAFKITSTRKGTARFCSRACQAQSNSFREECAERQRGEKSWRWQGGEYEKKPYLRTKGKNELVHRKLMQSHMLEVVPDHPFLVMWRGKKKLAKHIHVHHIDRNWANNDLSNLLAVTIDAHAKIHHSGRKPEPWECWPPNPERW